MTDEHAAAPPRLQARGVSKHFGSVVALRGVDLDLYDDEVLALCGDNGAGKSTLIKILSGALTPDAGQLLMDGRPVRFASPWDARRRGIETVYQDLALSPALDVVSNIFLSRERRRRDPLGWLLRMVDRGAMLREAREHLDSLRIELPSLREPVENLSGGQRQAVAVARAVAWGQRLVIMDEPTAALGVTETEMVLDLIRAVKQRGVPVIVISHDLPEVFQVADRIQVLRLGQPAGIAHPGRNAPDDVVRMMAGLDAA